ncbi:MULTISPECIES: DUF433 domain-containing protein [unclassified Caulobacter]|uniref:DUF433 domain-containing protein n=1 Tax=unclassified Caulobacter TaxID=2648921 RepID=UPI0007811D9E|nr:MULTISPECIES: DUF433 domain-containing protein [unclassified Caulobacter]AZS19915.1 DUF433 domain-containing protein [Caulobacter sp. FWC26]
MPAKLDLLTPTEAAVVAGVTVRDVNRIIDTRVLPERFYAWKGGRRLRSSGCTYVRFYVHAAGQLTADERALLIERAAAQTRPDTSEWTIQDGFLTYDLTTMAADTEARLSKLERARELVVEDPEILSGTPVIRGTRVPVYDVAASVAAGLSVSDILEGYPSLNEEKVELAVIFADATPQRGRPRRMHEINPSLKVISSKKAAVREAG